LSGSAAFRLSLSAGRSSAHLLTDTNDQLAARRVLLWRRPLLSIKHQFYSRPSGKDERGALFRASKLFRSDALRTCCGSSAGSGQVNLRAPDPWKEALARPTKAHPTPRPKRPSFQAWRSAFVGPRARVFADSSRPMAASHLPTQLAHCVSLAPTLMALVLSHSYASLRPQTGRLALVCEPPKLVARSLARRLCTLELGEFGAIALAGRVNKRNGRA